jgi:crossover junction endodeoxyribonuclease RuvC
VIFIGIDPGITGAIAAIDDQAQVELCADLPVIRSGKLAWIDANELTTLLMTARNGRPARIIVERAQSMPGQGISSTFGYGVVLGSILAACQRIAVPLDLVPAAVWKRAMGLDSQKAGSLDRARLQFPTAELDRKKDHNRAEALLIAEYCWRSYTRSVNVQRDVGGGVAA